MKKNLLFTLALLFIIPSFGKAQTFYGTTFRGGTDSTYGTLFSFNAANNNEKVISSLNRGTGPQNPLGSLTYDSKNGMFYCLSCFGGANNRGAIVQLDPSTNKDSVVWSFANDTTDGDLPYGSLLYDSANGLLYGMTYGGGNSAVAFNEGDGVIFSFNPNGNVEKVLWNFKGYPSDGAIPKGNLTLDPVNGLLYGMTTFGGKNISNSFFAGGGTLFSFDIATNKDSVLWNFGNGTDAACPIGSLVFDSGNGLFYAVTEYGGITDTSKINTNGDGTIISFNPTNNTENLLWNFGSGTDGQQPDGDLVYDTNSQLFYGTTLLGGSNLAGTIFSFNPGDNAENVVWSFGKGTDASRPNASLVYDADNGLYYGTTVKGGANNTSDGGDGTIFSFNPKGDAENVVWSFGNGTDGNQPYGNLAVYPPSIGAGINQLAVSSEQLTIFPNPSPGQFIIKLNDNRHSYSVEIYNVVGRQVYQSVLANSQKVISLSSQPDGMYFVQVKSEKGVATEKILIVK